MRGLAGGPLFWNFMANNVADAIPERDDGKSIGAFGTTQESEKGRKIYVH